jgi:hypothetical protein
VLSFGKEVTLMTRQILAILVAFAVLTFASLPVVAEESNFGDARPSDARSADMTTQGLADEISVLSGSSG